MGFCDDLNECTPDTVEAVGHTGAGGVDGSSTVLAYYPEIGATVVAHAGPSVPKEPTR